jgi:hypothetical protein
MVACSIKAAIRLCGLPTKLGSKFFASFDLREVIAAFRKSQSVKVVAVVSDSVRLARTVMAEIERK